MSASASERALLGALLIEPGAVWDVRDLIEPRDCSSTAHQDILEMIFDLADDGDPVDLVSATQRLRDRGRLERVGGAVAVSDLVDACPDVAHVAHYARQVVAESLRRQAGVLEAEAKEITGTDGTPADLARDLGRFAASAADLAGRAAGERSRATDARSVAHEAIELALRLADEGTSAAGIPTGLLEVDAKIGGLRPDRSYTIGGGTSSGKTSLATQVAVGAALIPGGGAVVYFSLEMSREQLVSRLLAAGSQVSAELLVNGLLGDWAARRLEAAAEGIPDRLLIDDASALSVLDIRARCRRLAARGRLDLVVVDYLQLVRPIGRGRTRTEEVGEVTRDLHVLARELKAPVLCLAQLNRSADRDGRRPALHDLRESGSIEQDSDVVLLLHRPDLGRPEAELIIAKNRQGPAGHVVRLLYSGAECRFRGVGGGPDA